jgi:hypothetical protein
LTSTSRERSNAREACCSSLLIATGRMSGRCAATQIAAASRASVLFRFTNGLT